MYLLMCTKGNTERVDQKPKKLVTFRGQVEIVGKNGGDRNGVEWDGGKATTL